MLEFLHADMLEGDSNGLKHHWTFVPERVESEQQKAEISANITIFSSQFVISFASSPPLD